MRLHPITPDERGTLSAEPCLDPPDFDDEQIERNEQRRIERWEDEEYFGESQGSLDG